MNSLIKSVIIGVITLVVLYAPTAVLANNTKQFIERSKTCTHCQAELDTLIYECIECGE